MTPKSLFNIILKLIGIFFIKDVIVVGMQLLSIPFMFRGAEDGWSIIISILVLVAYLFITYCLIFKTDLIIDKLRLDKGFDQETIFINIHRSAILSIALIAIGGFLIVDEVPSFCQQLYVHYSRKRVLFGAAEPDFSALISIGAKIIIGLLLIGNQRVIVNFIELRRKK